MLVKIAEEEVLLPISVLGRVANRQGWHFQQGYTCVLWGITLLSAMSPPVTTEWH